MTWMDWVAVAIIALCALSGLRRGLIGTALSLAGLAGGAVVGYRLAPHVAAGSLRLPTYVPLVPLAGAVVGAVVLATVASLLASMTRRSLRFVPPLRWLDSLAGLVAGALFGVVLVWALGAVALAVPGEPSLRAAARASGFVRRLDALVSTGDLLRALGRIEHLPHGGSPIPPAPTHGVLVGAEASVVHIGADDCGVAIAGSGWVVAPHLVVTAARVVSGAAGLRVDGKPAYLVTLDADEGVAVLDAPELQARPLRTAAARNGTPVAIVGDGASDRDTTDSGSIGPTTTRTERGATIRTTLINGVVPPGGAGAPAVDGNGAVESTIVSGARNNSGRGAPLTAIDTALRHARLLRRVAPGPC
jgi:hypothetical protein